MVSQSWRKPASRSSRSWSLVLGHSGVPLTSVLEPHLTASLLKEIASLRLVGKPAEALAADNALGPVASHKFVKESQVERAATVVHECADAVLLDLASLVVVIMVVVMMVVLVIMVFMVVVVMMVLTFLMVMVVVTLLIVVYIIVVVLYLIDPGGGGCYLVEIEAARVDNAV